jgi:hypothetical protein
MTSCFKKSAGVIINTVLSIDAGLLEAVKAIIFVNFLFYFFPQSSVLQGCAIQ